MKKLNRKVDKIDKKLDKRIEETNWYFENEIHKLNDLYVAKG